jgi:hypothetical protein
MSTRDAPTLGPVEALTVAPSPVLSVGSGPIGPVPKDRSHALLSA